MSKECSGPRLGAIAVPVLLAFELSCGAPKLHHVDGRPFIAESSIMSFDGGWIAIDSCALGIHALLELEVPVAHRNASPPILDHIALSVGVTPFTPAAAIDQAGVVCWTDMARVQTSGAVPSTRATGHPSQQTCVYRLRLEFELSSLPKAGDSFQLMRDREVVRLEWRP